MGRGRGYLLLLPEHEASGTYRGVSWWCRGGHGRSTRAEVAREWDRRPVSVSDRRVAYGLLGAPTYLSGLRCYVEWPRDWQRQGARTVRPPQAVWNPPRDASARARRPRDNAALSYVELSSYPPRVAIMLNPVSFSNRHMKTRVLYVRDALWVLFAFWNEIRSFYVFSSGLPQGGNLRAIPKLIKPLQFHWM